MVRAYKPSWVGKGCREVVLSTLSETAENLMMDYCKLAGTVYIWDGLEKCGMKPRHMENIIFWNRAIGIADGNVITGCSSVLANIYNEPVDWYPVASTVYGLPKNFIRKYETKKGEPAMSLGEQSTAESIKDECVTQASSYVSVDQNIIGMRTPIVIVGIDGQVEIKWLSDSLIEGNIVLPYLDLKAGKTARTFPIEALNTGVQNFLDPLSMMCEFMHAKTLGKLGIDALGTQKASGITEEEAVLILAQIKAVREAGLELREDICEMIKKKTGKDVSVKIRPVFMKDVNVADREDTVGSGNIPNGSTDKTKEE